MFPAKELSFLVVGLLKDTQEVVSRLKTSALEFSFPGLTILYWYALRMNAQHCSIAEARRYCIVFPKQVLQGFVICEDRELVTQQEIVELLYSKNDS